MNKSKKLTAEEKARLADMIRADAKKLSIFPKAAAFYWLKAENPNMAISDAVEIVDMLSDGDDCPFVEGIR